MFSLRVGLSIHEGEDWVQDIIRESLVVRSHRLPQIVGDLPDRNITIWQSFAATQRFDAIIVGFASFR